MKCPGCGNDYDSLGGHWRYNPEHRPKITKHQHEILTGIVMGDGHVDRPNGGKPRLNIQMITKEYLEYIDKKFGILSTGVRLSKTAEDMKENARSTNSVTEEYHNFSDVYYMQTRRHPELCRYDKWYSTGKKVWDDIKLTPTVLKHWYVCDGGMVKQKYGKGRIVISAHNEVGNEEKINKMFRDENLPTPKHVVREDERYSTGKSYQLKFTVSETDYILKYMGYKPLPGFEYKWEV